MAIFNLALTHLSDRTPPEITSSVGATTSIDENVGTGSLVATVTADATAASMVLTSGNSAGNFSYDTATGDLTVSSSANLDYETTANTYALVFTATDALGNASTFTLTVNINDVDELAPVVTKTQSFFASIDEDNNNQIIAEFTITDNGVPVTSGATMSATPNSTNFGFFYNATAGVWRLRSTSSGRLGGGVTSDQTFVFTISYTDNVNLTGSATHTLTVLDVDAPTLTKDSLQTTISELPPSNTDIVRFKAIAADGSNVSSNLSISISPNGTGFSERMNNANTKNIIRADGGATLGGGSVTADTPFTITATGTGSDGSVDTLSHAITVTNAEAPTISGPNSISRNENTSNTTTIGTYSATGTSPISWSLTGTDQNDFTITNSGQLRFASSPDYENPTDNNTNNVYSVGVVATNQYGTDTRNVTVTVNNVVEPTWWTFSNASASGLSAFTMVGTTAYWFNYVNNQAHKGTLTGQGQQAVSFTTSTLSSNYEAFNNAINRNGAVFVNCRNGAYTGTGQQWLNLRINSSLAVQSSTVVPISPQSSFAAGNTIYYSQGSGQYEWFNGGSNGAGTTSLGTTSSTQISRGGRAVVGS